MIIPLLWCGLQVNAAPLIVRRDLLLTLGGLHPALSCPGDPGISFDFELSVRMWAEGHQASCLPIPACVLSDDTSTDLLSPPAPLVAPLYKTRPSKAELTRPVLAILLKRRCTHRSAQVGLFQAKFGRAAHGDPLSSGGRPSLTSGTRKNKAKHRVRIDNYHRNNQALYGMFPGLHHERGTQLALKASRALPRSDGQQRSVLD